jgi:hypothetical protein
MKYMSFHWLFRESLHYEKTTPRIHGAHAVRVERRFELFSCASRVSLVGIINQRLTGESDGRDGQTFWELAANVRLPHEVSASVNTVNEVSLQNPRSLQFRRNFVEMLPRSAQSDRRTGHEERVLHGPRVHLGSRGETSILDCDKGKN